MGRKSKLTPDQWAEALRRVVGGEATRAVARDFGVSESTLREKISAQSAQVKSVAQQMVAADAALRALPVSAQLVAVDLAAALRTISGNLAQTAAINSGLSLRLSGIAAGQAAKISDDDPMGAPEQLQAVSALTKMSNDAMSLPLALVAANNKSGAVLGSVISEEAAPAPMIIELVAPDVESTD